MRLNAFVKGVDAQGGSPNISVQVDIEEALEAIRRLKDEQIPSFMLQYLKAIALEARTVMVQFSSSPYINRRTNGLVNSINIFPVPDGFVVGPSIYYAKWVYEGHKDRGGGWVLGRPAHDWTAETIRERAPGIALALANKFLGGEK